MRKRLDNRRLIDIPPFVLRELTPDALTVLVVAKFLGIVRVEVPSPSLYPTLDVPSPNQLPLEPLLTRNNGHRRRSWS